MNNRKTEGKRCPVCNHELLDDANFCIACGNRVMSSQPRIQYGQNQFNRVQKSQETEGVYKQSNNKKNMVKLAAIIAAAAIAGGTVLTFAAPELTGSRSVSFTKNREASAQTEARQKAEVAAAQNKDTKAAGKGKKENANKGAAEQEEKQTILEKLIIITTGNPEEKETKTAAAPVAAPQAKSNKQASAIKSTNTIRNTENNTNQKVDVHITNNTDYSIDLLAPVRGLLGGGAEAAEESPVVVDGVDEDGLLTSAAAAGENVTESQMDTGEEEAAEMAEEIAEMPEDASEETTEVTIIEGTEDIPEDLLNQIREEDPELAEELAPETPEETTEAPAETAEIPTETVPEDTPVEEAAAVPEEAPAEEMAAVPEEAPVEEPVEVPEETAEEASEETAGLSNQELAQRAKAYYRETVGDTSEDICVMVDGGSGGCLGADGSWTPGTDSSCDDKETVFVRLYDPKCVPNGGNGTLMTYTVDRAGNVTENW